MTKRCGGHEDHDESEGDPKAVADEHEAEIVMEAASVERLDVRWRARGNGAPKRQGLSHRTSIGRGGQESHEAKETQPSDRGSDDEGRHPSEPASSRHLRSDVDRGASVKRRWHDAATVEALAGAFSGVSSCYRD